MEKCPYCNSKVENDSLFCTNCGKRLAKQVDSEMAIKGERIKGKSKKMIILALVIGLCVIIGGGVFFYLKNDSQLNNESQTASIQTSESTEEGEVICPEPRCGGVEVTDVSVVASNVLANQASNSYQATNLLDNDWTTAWATHFIGNEETLTFRMNANKLYKLSIVNGYNKSVESFENNSRAKDIKVYINGVLASSNELTGIEQHRPEWITFEKEYDNVEEVKIIISSIHKGNKWNDLCISDICFFTKE